VAIGDFEMASCYNEIMQRVNKIWKLSHKASNNTHCANIHNRGLKAFRKLWPSGTVLSCNQLEKGFETAATTYGRVQQCVKQPQQSQQPANFEPFVEVTPRAKKAKGRVMMSEYLCDDLALPMIVAHHKSVAAAKREAAKDKKLCYRIHTVKDL